MVENNKAGISGFLQSEIGIELNITNTSFKKNSGSSNNGVMGLHNIGAIRMENLDF